MQSSCGNRTTLRVELSSVAAHQASRQRHPIVDRRQLGFRRRAGLSHAIHYTNWSALLTRKNGAAEADC